MFSLAWVLVKISLIIAFLVEALRFLIISNFHSIFTYYSLFSWMNDNIALITLFLTLILTISNMQYTRITSKMLKLSSQPTLKIQIKDINFSEGIKVENLSDIGTIIDNIKNIHITINTTISNIGNSPAQKIFLDADTTFKNRRPLNRKNLPIPSYNFIDFLGSSEEIGSSNEVKDLLKSSIAFKGFVSQEIIKDFFEGRKDFKGFPTLPHNEEMKDPNLWPSPKVRIVCFYSDIQENVYCSELEFFFHIWVDKENNNELKIYSLNLEDIGFLGVRQVTKKHKQEHFRRTRNFRYCSFWGKEFRQNELVLLRAERKKEEYKK